MPINSTKSIAKRWEKRLLFIKTPKPDEIKEIRVRERAGQPSQTNWLSGTRNIIYKLAEK